MKDFSEENVTILNADEDGSHTFQENGTFTFELRDKAGNMGYVTAEVTWIENGDSGKLEIDSEVYHVGDNGIIKNINANTAGGVFEKYQYQCRKHKTYQRWKRDEGCCNRKRIDTE